MIPKCIHYCWFGDNQLPAIGEKCIESWKKYCPDYRIIEWNETNFDIEYNSYAREAYETKAWAHVSDIARLYILYMYGGIYLDIDVELIKPLDDLLYLDAFGGFEYENKEKYINTGLIFGTVQGHPWIKALLDEYAGERFCFDNGKQNRTTCPIYNTNATKKLYNIKIENEPIELEKGVMVFPPSYFSPKSFDDGKVCIKDETYSIHHFAGTWLSKDERIVNYLSRHVGARAVALYTGIRERGLLGEIKHFISKTIK